MTEPTTPPFLRPLETLGERLREADLPQIAALCLALLIVVLALAWPSRTGTANESWVAVAQARSLIVALVSLSYGVLSTFTVARRATVNVVAVMMVAMSLLPIESLAHAGSVPTTPGWWAWLSTPFAVMGQMAIAALATMLLARVGLRNLAPLLPVVLVAAFIALDLRFDFTALNPLSAALQVSPVYVTVMGCAALVGAAVLVLGHRRSGQAAP